MEAMHAMTTVTKMTRDELAALVGEMAALMVFGQGGACVGRSFKLSRVRGKGTVDFTMSVLDGELCAVVVTKGVACKCAHCGRVGADVRDRTGERGDVGEAICDRCVASNIAHGREAEEDDEA